MRLTFIYFPDPDFHVTISSSPFINFLRKVRLSTMSVISPGLEAVEGSNEAALGEGIQGTILLPPIPLFAKSVLY